MHLLIYTSTSSSAISVHYESKAQFLTATEVVREIEVSHWGNVAVTEYIELQHTGAKLKVTARCLSVNIVI